MSPPSFFLHPAIRVPAPEDRPRSFFLRRRLFAAEILYEFAMSHHPPRSRLYLYIYLVAEKYLRSCPTSLLFFSPTKIVLTFLSRYAFISL